MSVEASIAQQLGGATTMRRATHGLICCVQDRAETTPIRSVPRWAALYPYSATECHDPLPHRHL